MTTNALTTKTLFAQENVKAKIEELLGKRATSFITSVLQIVNSNALLKDADPMSVYNSACLAATLDLPLNNNFGFAYIVPYKNQASFQMGYKGYIQLALRSGQFKTISATPIYEGQIKSSNPLTGYEFDFTIKNEKIIGYAAYFSLLNGFEKTIYWTSEEIEKHAKRYSQTYRKGFGNWKDDFDKMALKTVLKELLSKYAPLSVEMQKAIIADQSIIKNNDTMDVEHIDLSTPEDELKSVLIKIIDGLEFYQGKDKEEIQNICSEKQKSGQFTMDFANKIAKKIGVDL